ncbi:Rv1355c family protein [Nocardia higoensis]|uniref:Rv1355c family protein n=1 Tax=Nocardia higoensis TaxID=228599 RepID=UPI001E32AC75|nr:Rv1355c family protein [Nocardia higoensis]
MTASGTRPSAPGVGPADAAERYRPLILDEHDADHTAVLTRLRTTPTVGILDLRDSIRAELSRICDPRIDTEDAAADRWVYYPWRRTLVGLTGPRAFRAVRLDRNRNKLTVAEQERLAGMAVGVVGQSVGHAIAHTLALEGSCGLLRLADFDDIELSNLNRVPGTLFDLGLNKAVVTARRIAELDPYLPVEVCTGGVDENSVDAFLSGLSLVLEECDSLDVKFAVRDGARRHRLPLLMDTSDRGLFDVERFDLEPDRPPFHGLLGETAAADLRGLSTKDKAPHVLRILGPGELSARMAASLAEIDRTVTTWPQLGGDVQLGAAIAATAVRRIGLGRDLPSGRTRVDLERELDGLVEPMSTDHRWSRAGADDDLEAPGHDGAGLRRDGGQPGRAIADGVGDATDAALFGAGVGDTGRGARRPSRAEVESASGASMRGNGASKPTAAFRPGDRHADGGPRRAQSRPNGAGYRQQAVPDLLPPGPPRAEVVAAAQRAPSGGNVQPWTMRPTEDALWIDLAPERSSTMDVAYRGSAVAIGAALHNARAAAAAYGLLGEHRLIAAAAPPSAPLTAVLRFGAGGDPLLARDYPAALTRCTNRRKGNRAPIRDGVLAALDAAARTEGALVRAITDRGALAEAAELLGASDRVRMLTPRMHRELFSELRGPGEDVRDGIDLRSMELDDADLAKLRIASRPDVVELLRVWSGGHGLGEATRDQLLSGSALIAVTMPCPAGRAGASLIDYARAGMAVERVWLEAGRRGLAVQPMSPVFGYAHDQEDLVAISEDFADTLTSLQGRFLDLLGVPGHEIMALVLRLSYAAAASVRSRRLPVPGTGQGS